MKMLLNVVFGFFVDLGAETIWLSIRTIRRQSETTFVFVNQDGSVREISGGEQQHQTPRFDPFDGARPYIKSRYFDTGLRMWLSQDANVGSTSQPALTLLGLPQ